MLCSQRKEMDITELLMRDFKVMREDKLDMLEVVFYGPKLTPYEGGVWRIRVDIPSEYPFEPPKLFFVNHIFHPNIDFVSGFICLDILSEYWIAKYDLVDIFKVFVPQLLRQPNPERLANLDAAELLEHDEGEYKQEVIEYCEMYARKEDILSESSSGYKESGIEEYISDSEEGSGSSEDESP